MSTDAKTAYGATAPFPAEWPGLTISALRSDPSAAEIQLDAVYKEIRPGSWLVLVSPIYRELYGVTEVEEDARARFGISSKTTRVILDGENLTLFDGQLRQTMVFAASEPLRLAERPIETPLPSGELPLAGAFPQLEKGRLLIVTGLSLIHI